MVVTFTFRSVEFNIDLPTTGTVGSEMCVFNIDTKMSANIVEQYCKAKHPDVRVRIETEDSNKFSALHVYMCNEDATTVSKEAYEDIKAFAKLFEYDTYLKEWYNPKNVTGVTNDKVIIKLIPSVNDVYAYYLPKIGTPEWIEYQIKVLGVSVDDVTAKVKKSVVGEWKKQYA